MKKSRVKKKSRDNIWLEISRKKREETHQSFLEDCFGKKFNKFDFEYYLKKCIEELETWLYNSKKDKIKQETNKMNQNLVGKDIKISQIRMPDLNIDQIDRIMRTEEGPDLLNIKPNLEISKLIQQSQLVGFKSEASYERKKEVVSII